MKVVAFNGSPHKEGNTSILLGQALSELKKEGIETEMVHLKGPLLECIACFQ
jgi:multimeric flavodoxin WrbA